MAIETRAVQFSRDPDFSGVITPQTLDLPLDRTYKGIVTSPSGPALIVTGDWDSMESVTISFSQWNTLPTTENVVGTWGDGGNDFFGVCIEY